MKLYFLAILFVSLCIEIYSAEYIHNQDQQRCQVFTKTRDEKQAQRFTHNISHRLTDSRQVDYSRTATLEERQKIYKAMMGSVIIHDLSHTSYKRDNLATDQRYNSHFEALEIIDLYAQKLWNGVKQDLYIHNLNQLCDNSYHRALLTDYFVIWFYESLKANRPEHKDYERTATIKSLQKTTVDLPASDSLKYQEDEQLYQKGIGLRNKKKFYEAIECFKPLSEKKNTKAQHNLAFCLYELGDKLGAYQWYQIAADQGFAPSVRNLQKLVKEMEAASLLRLPNEILLGVVQYLDYNSLLSLRTTAKSPAAIVEEEFRRRSDFKLTVACLKPANQSHPFPHTVSFSLRKLLNEIPTLKHTSCNVINSSRFIQCADFCHDWNYLGESLFRSIGNALVNPLFDMNIKGIVNNFMRSINLSEGVNVEIVDPDYHEIKLWYIFHFLKDKLASFSIKYEFATLIDINVAQKRAGIVVPYLVYIRNYLLEQNNFQNARWFLQVTADCGDDIAQNDLGFALVNEGNTEEAKKYFKLASEKGCASAQFNLATLLEKEGDLEQAKEYYKMATDQNFVLAQLNLGLLLMKEGKTEEGGVFVQKAANQGNVTAQMNVGLTYAQRGDMENAKKYYRKAAEQGHSVVYMPLGNILLDEGNYIEAKKYFYMAADLDSDLAQYQLGVILEKEGHAKEAKNHYKIAADLGLNIAQLILATIFEKEGNEECRRYYQLAADQGLDMAQHSFGHFLEQKREIAQAKRYYQAAADQGYIKALISLARLFENEGDIENATKYYKIAAKKGNIAAQLLLGARLHERGNIKGAKKYYKLAADQGDATAQNTFGGIMEEEGDSDQALKYIKMAADQGFSYAQFNLALILENEGNIVEAEKYYQKAADQNISNAQLNLGLIYYRKGMITQAIKWWEIAASLGNTQAQKNLLLFRIK